MDNFFKFALIGIIIAFVMNLSPKQVELKPSEINQWFNIAEKYDGVKYEYGGDSFEGIDCSGYIIKMYNSIGSYIFKYKNGYALDVSSQALYEYNTKYIEFGDLKKGDLIFYDVDNNSKIDHVMLYDRADAEGNIWVWDAAYKIDEKLINKVSHRKATEIFRKNPKYGRPLKLKLANDIFDLLK
ncbi:C40 family peptidase [Geotoga petraea]|uniref:Hydrolase n=1 Tax=Geotoga petraea TaxID=28234 RepID=A0A1G6QHU4_9BACT|nr:NlpC/P60 family protein [Geotoga petraea]TGG89294.1 hydrolase [Geotoga petraea]SDC91286.1 NlpC/P60 family protein [Geotoga petraea]